MIPAANKRKMILLGLLLTGVVVLGVYLSARLITGGAATKPPTRAAQILTLMNQRRVAAHLHPLKMDLVLSSLARFHVKNMRRDGFFAHGNPQGQTFYERLAYLHRRQIGETLVYGSAGFGTASGLMSLWMASPGHRRVILTPGFRRVGISVIVGPFMGNKKVCLAVADFSS